MSRHRRRVATAIGLVLLMGLGLSSFLVRPPAQQPAMRAWEAPRANTLAVSPDGRTVACGRPDGAISLHDPRNGGEKGTLTGHESPVTMLSFSRDGALLASVEEAGKIKVWDLASGDETLISMGLPDGIAAAFSPVQPRVLALSGGKDVTLLDLENGRTLGQFWLSGWDTGPRLAFSPDGKTLAVGETNGALQFFDLERMKTRFSFPGHEGEVTALAFAPDGKTLVSASKDRTVKLWDTRSGLMVRELPKRARAAESVTFSRDGRVLATADSEGALVLWDPATGQPRLELREAGPVTALAFADNGRTLFTVAESEVHKWDLTGDVSLRHASAGRRFSPQLIRLTVRSSLLVLVLVLFIVLLAAVRRRRSHRTRAGSSLVSRCPACWQEALRPVLPAEPPSDPQADSTFECEACGTRFLQRQGGPWETVSSAPDDSTWVGRFLPTVRDHRRRTRPR